MSNGHVSAGGAVGVVSSAWQLVGIGDVNGDGTSDVLWRNTATGQVTSWVIDNGHVAGSGAVGHVSTAWQPVTASG